MQNEGMFGQELLIMFIIFNELYRVNGCTKHQRFVLDFWRMY